MDVVVSNLGWLSWIIFGALAGWIASIFTGNNSRMGCLSNIIVGIVGAFLGGWIYSLITGHPLTVGWNWTAFIVAVLGAVVLLAVLSLFFRRRRA
ncbi:MAG TPA: GlsB/YeaQ/YmgE family stress response membrane protein [Ktedonobacteraceae bacterium]